MSDDFHLVVEYHRVQDPEGGIVEDPGQHDILQILQPVGLVDLPDSLVVLDPDNLLVPPFLIQPLPVVGFMAGEVRVIF